MYQRIFMQLLCHFCRSFSLGDSARLSVLGCQGAGPRRSMLRITFLMARSLAKMIRTNPTSMKPRSSYKIKSPLELWPILTSIRGLVQNRHFSGNTTDGERALTSKVRRCAMRAMLLRRG